MEKTVLDVNEIMKLLPHRYPFLMVDKVLELKQDHSIVALKNVTANEPFFTGHFPGRPVMPGVMMLEAMAQAAAILAKTCSYGEEFKTVVLVGADKFRWKKMVQPGDTLIIEVCFTKQRRPMWCIDGKITVDGSIVAMGSLSAMESDVVAPGS